MKKKAFPKKPFKVEVNGEEVQVTEERKTDARAVTRRIRKGYTHEEVYRLCDLADAQQIALNRIEDHLICTIKNVAATNAETNAKLYKLKGALARALEYVKLTHGQLASLTCNPVDADLRYCQSVLDEAEGYGQ